MITSSKNSSSKKPASLEEKLIHAIFDETPEESAYWEAFKNGQSEAWEAAKQIVAWAFDDKDIDSLDKFEKFIHKWFVTDDVMTTVAKIQDKVDKEQDKKDLESKISYLSKVVSKKRESGDKAGAYEESKLLRWLEELQWYRNKDTDE